MSERVGRKKVGCMNLRMSNFFWFAILEVVKAE